MDKILNLDFSLIKDLLSFDRQNPLLFNSGLFLLLFAAFMLIYQCVRRVRWLKMITVIAFSLYFYYKSSAGYCFILLGAVSYTHLTLPTIGG